MRILLCTLALAIAAPGQGMARDVAAQPFSKSLAIRLAESAEIPLRGVIKFAEGSGLRVGARGPESATGAATADVELMRVQQSLRQYGRTLSPLIRDVEAIAAFERRVAGIAPSRDLRLYAAFDTEGRSAREWRPLLQALNASPLVEIAYLESQDSDTGGLKPPNMEITLPGTTPSFTYLQGYLKPAPQGIGAGNSWAKPGGTGEGVRVMVYDNSYRTTHEDVPDTFYHSGNNGVSDAHGTAVLGIIGAPANKIGIKGIAHGASIGFQHSASALESHAERLVLAAMELDAGDVLLTEVGKKVQSLGFSCECNPTQANSVPVEFYPAEFDVIQAIGALGITVVETAGNGCVDFDSPVFEDKFSNSGNSSGAILAGASESGQRVPMCYSNYGARVDVHAWGESVVTLSYLRENEIPVFDKGPDRLYVPNFGGTSSAGAIVAGAVASLQGRAWASQGAPLSPDVIRELFVETGTPQTGGLDRPIGPMPNLDAISF
jgi:hypothetical protein